MPDRIPFLDLHAHFPMHTRFPPMPFENPLDFWRAGAFDAANLSLNYEALKPRVSLERWFADPNPQYAVTGFGSVLYNAQEDFFVNVNPIPLAFKHICAQMDNVEAEISASSQPVEIARSPAQVDNFLETGQRFIFHTLEGGFSLGGDAANVKTLAERGVACITPAHLFYRSVSTCENGFPPFAYPLFRKELESQPADVGLTSVGVGIVTNCFEQGVVVDITHARDDAQAQIFEIADGYPHRPLISSHNSVRGICAASLNLSEDAIRRIHLSGGIIGVIFYTQWLRRLNVTDARPDMQLITDVIDYIYGITGTYDNIGIGSDLDGFIDPIKTCANYSQMSSLSLFLISKYGRPVAEQILYRNAVRVLYAGWDGVSA